MTQAAPHIGTHREPIRRVLLLYVGASVIIIGIGLVLGLWREQSQIAARERAVARVGSPDYQAPALVSEKTSSGPAAARVDKKARANELIGRASTMVDSDPGRATTLLLEAMKLDPTSIQAYLQLGFVYVKQKEYSKAIETYQKVANLEPQLADVYFNLGYAYAMSKDYPKAEEMYTRTVKLSPSYIDEALFNLGMVQKKQGKNEEAAKNFERSLSANPGNERARQEVERSKAKIEKGK